MNIDSKHNVIRIERTNNGWVLYPHDYRTSREGYALPDAFVASTPDQLGKLVDVWAKAQHTTPKKGA